MEKSEKYQKLAESWLIEKNLDRFMTVLVVHDEKYKPDESKLLGKIVKTAKYHDLVIDVDVFIVIREDYLDELEFTHNIEQRDLAFERILEYINWDAENDKFVKVKPDFIEHSGMVKNYGFDKIEANKIAIQQIIEKMEENS